jgi:hypothetical protein
MKSIIKEYYQLPGPDASSKAVSPSKNHSLLEENRSFVAAANSESNLNSRRSSFQQ